MGCKELAVVQDHLLKKPKTSHQVKSFWLLVLGHAILEKANFSFYQQSCHLSEYLNTSQVPVKNDWEGGGDRDLCPFPLSLGWGWGLGCSLSQARAGARAHAAGAAGRSNQ